VTVQLPQEIEVPLEVPKTQTRPPAQPEVKQDIQVSNVSKRVSIKEDSTLDLRRTDASGRGGRKFNSSQASVSRKTNGSSNTVPNLVSSVSTQRPNRRPSNYIDKLSEGSDSISRTSTSSDKLTADIPMMGVEISRRITTANSPPQEEKMRSASRSENHKNVAEVNESRSTGQFRNKPRVSAGSERSVGQAEQRTYIRNSLKSGAPADAVPSSNPRSIARDFSHQMSSRSRDVTEVPLKSRDGSRRSHFRGQDFDLHKVTSACTTALFKYGFFDTEN
jgi:hypothetical protein